MPEQPAPLDDASDVSIRKKTPLQKDENHFLRQEQISSYRTAVLKEERERRLRLRHGEEESPKKRKRVSFGTASESLPSKSPRLSKSPSLPRKTPSLPTKTPSLPTKTLPRRKSPNGLPKVPRSPQLPRKAVRPETN